jgi:solute carrier family 25 (mitochondrial S-adenosylmethionine transporter), member 26
MDEKHNFLALFTAGGIAGASIDLVLHPLDYIKTRQHGGKALNLSIRSVYQGLTAGLLASFPCAATFWGFYMLSKQELKASGVSPIYFEPISAVIGSFCCCLVRNPFERIKQLAQIGEKSKLAIIFNDIIKEHGSKGLYKGFSALCIRELPFDTIQMIVFQSLVHLKLINLQEINSFFYGAIAGAITSLITAPVDVIKTRMMINPQEFKFFFQSSKLLYEKEGLKAFFLGWKVRMMYITIGGTMFFGVFDSSLRLFN